MKWLLFEVLEVEAQIACEARSEAATILLVDQMAGLALADRAYLLEGGRIVAAGTTSEIARDGALEKAYLAVNS